MGCETPRKFLRFSHRRIRSSSDLALILEPSSYLHCESAKPGVQNDKGLTALSRKRPFHALCSTHGEDPSIETCVGSAPSSVTWRLITIVFFPCDITADTRMCRATVESGSEDPQVIEIPRRK
jgi:hypothetical protein